MACRITGRATLAGRRVAPGGDGGRSAPWQGISPEGGGDMAGTIFTTRSDVDFFNTTGNEFLTWIQ